MKEYEHFKRSSSKPTLLTWFISLVWLINGLMCKVLGMVPRHELIVARITGYNHAHLLTLSIGFGETMLAIAIIYRLYPRLLAQIQIVLVLVMNIIEYCYARDLLLFGPWNLFFACCFCLLIVYYSFKQNDTFKYV